MPCKQCKDGKYKWGNTGECKYSTKEACEKSNPKKYNKMQPTPLGKKTYEEYAKELKEFNLSSQRVELGLVDDLDKLVSQSKSISQDLTKDVSDYAKQDDIVQKLYQQKTKVEEEFKKLEQESEVEARRVKVYYDAMQENLKAARDIRQKMEKDLDTVKKQAKELGVDIPLGKYESAIEISKKATGKAVSVEPLPF
tara:strand:- start:58 stop:645 length:588 start_codon:yes stop_codon:yes gene_type:complete